MLLTKVENAIEGPSVVLEGAYAKGKELLKVFKGPLRQKRRKGILQTTDKLLTVSQLMVFKWDRCCLLFNVPLGWPYTTVKDH